MTETPESKLLYAIGRIDDEYVEEASTPYRKATIFEIFSSKPVRVIAASFVCAVMVIFAVVLLQPKFDSIFDAELGGSANKNDHPNADMVPYPTLYVNGAALTVVDITDTSYTFLLEITESQSSIDFTIKGRDNDGNSIVSTTLTATPEGYRRVMSPKLIVDGKIAEKLPCESGTYNITIDVSELIGAGYILDDHFEVHPFGIIE